MRKKEAASKVLKEDKQEQTKKMILIRLSIEIISQLDSLSTQEIK